jgi:hypothetical protein
LRKTVHDYYRQAWQGFARAPRSGAWKGSNVEEAAAWEAQLLLRRHPEVPRERRDRAE